MPRLNPETIGMLLIGYGNPGRGDDGLGPAFAEAVERLQMPGVSVDANYQLTVEDAEAVARHPVVVFIDAELNGPGPFSFSRLSPAPTWNFESHRLGPGAVLALAAEVFGARPEGYLLGIRGYEFGRFEEVLSQRARSNLEAALLFFQTWIRDNNLSLGRAYAGLPVSSSGKEEK